jgi:hypothetical protein
MKERLTEEELIGITIDLGAARKGKLDESFLAMFGYWVKALLKRIFGGAEVPVNVKGSRSEIQSFANALGREKDYMTSLRSHGLHDKRTYGNKYKLDKAVQRFEKDTGLKWPFK